MKRQVIIDWSTTLIRVGVVDEGRLIGLEIMNQVNPSKQDWIIQGRVEKVVKNLKGVFVNFGEDKNGLLHLTQIPEIYKAKIQQGKRLPIQIKRENTGDKGHKLTANLNVKGDALIVMPFETGIYFSKKIKDEAVKTRIKTTLLAHQTQGYGFMVRTKAAEVSQEVLEDEILKLCQRTDKLILESQAVEQGTVLLKEVPKYIEVIKEQLSEGHDVTCVTNHPTIQEALRTYLGETFDSIDFKCMDKAENLFMLFSIEKAFESIFKNKIWLKNGGNIVIDYTEAMTIIDVNSAKAIQSKNQSKAVVELNQLAVEEAVGQIIKRNLSGIIIIDLVDFLERQEREAIVGYARNLLKKYGEKRSKIYPLTELDLLQIVRTKENLPYKNILQEECGLCRAQAGKMSALYHAFQVEKKIKHTQMHTESNKVFLTAKKEFLNYLKSTQIHTRLETVYGIKIELSEQNKMQEVYDIKYYED